MYMYFLFLAIFACIILLLLMVHTNAKAINNKKLAKGNNDMLAKNIIFNTKYTASPVFC